MAKEIVQTAGAHVSPFERIKRTNDANNEYWESRDLAEILEYTQYRNFEAVIEKAKLACFKIGKGGQRPVKVVDIFGNDTMTIVDV